MENIELLSFFDDYQIKLFVIVFFILLTVSGYFFYITRAKSNFSILWRFILIVLGREKGNSKKNELIDEIIEIEKFNFYYNTNAISIRQKERFEKWIRKNELDYRMISKLKNNFDIEKLNVINTPSKLYLRFLISILFIFFIAFSIAIPALVKLSHTNSALIYFKNDINKYWINNNEIIKFNYLDLYLENNNIAKLAYNNCKKDDNNLKISKEHFLIFCEYLVHNEGKDHIKHLLKEQHYSSRTMIIFLSIMLILFIKYIAKVDNIRRTDLMIQTKNK